MKRPDESILYITRALVRCFEPDPSAAAFFFTENHTKLILKFVLIHPIRLAGCDLANDLSAKKSSKEFVRYFHKEEQFKSSTVSAHGLYLIGQSQPLDVHEITLTQFQFFYEIIYIRLFGSTVFRINVIPPETI